LFSSVFISGLGAEFTLLKEMLTINDTQGL